ncbi:LPS biosynthesis protein [Candidatus Francisella endociliophora]|uniref:LPS biosynthesis protein n=1 Tax=Candidatus Francisella endociliophora TaxID=653937 RepID=A0A097EPZ7_9GAMM|nr:lysophospholipid acyltransferase family protein [Francisella sp. FSC1006]AIT09649.1 LPS biosynthesis protein [Francisella sp. FSC1006]
MDKSLLKPKYWGIWILIGIAKILVNILPYKVLMRLAIGIGYLAKPLMKKRNQIAITNLKIAFPEKSNKEIYKLANESYKSACMAGFESLIAWFMTRKRFNKIHFETNIESFEKIHFDKDKTVIVLGFHFHCLEIVGRYIGQTYSPFTVMYQKHGNPLMEHIITTSRKKYVNECFQRKNIISVIKSLKRKVSLWYAPDQDFKEHIVFAPFFGKLCATLTVTPLLAEKTNAIVIPAYYVRKPDLSGYLLVSGEELKFTGDAYKDAEMTNKFLEEAIRKYPEQYLWQHRRYKTRPPGEEQIY